MKKSIIALSVLAAASGAAQAQNVSITGIMDAMYLSGKHFGQGYKEIGQNGARTTSVQILGSEDLGGGLRANFRFEIQPLLVVGDGNGYNTNGSGFSAGTVTANGTAQTTGQASQQSGLTGKGYSFVGLSGGFGAVEFGTINSPSFRTFALGSGGLGTGIGSGYNITVGSTGTNVFTRFENAVMYQSPTISGVTFQFLTSLGNQSQWGTTTGVVLRRQGVVDYGVQWVEGPLSVRASMLTTKNSPNEAQNTATAPGLSNLETNTTTMAVAYNMGFARVGGMISNIKNDGGAITTGATGKTDTEAYQINVTVPLKTVRLMANYGQRSTNESPITALEGRKTQLTGLAAEYDLSKRTFLYARYESGKREDVNASSIVTNGAAGTTGVPANARISRMGLGVSHQF